MPSPAETNHDINHLLSKVEGAEVKQILVVLASMNQNMEGLHHSIIENSQLTRQVAERLEAHASTVKALDDRLEDHVVEEMKLINKGIGAWRTVAIVGPLFLSTVGGIGFAYLGMHLANLTREIGINERQQADIDALKGQMRAMEALAASNAQIISSHMLRLNAESK